MRQVQGPETGGAAPRSAHAGSHGLIALGGLVLFVVSLPAFVTCIASVHVVLRQRRRHWWEWALAALLVAVVVGVVMQLISQAMR